MKYVPSGADPLRVLGAVLAESGTSILIDAEGLAILVPAPTPFQEIRGVTRYYYVGHKVSVPVVIVAIGPEIETGQVWHASTGYEKGYVGFCLPGLEGFDIGKITLRRLEEANSETRKLSHVIKFYIERYS